MTTKAITLSKSQRAAAASHVIYRVPGWTQELFKEQKSSDLWQDVIQGQRGLFNPGKTPAVEQSRTGSILI